MCLFRICKRLDLTKTGIYIQSFERVDDVVELCLTCMGPVSIRTRSLSTPDPLHGLEPVPCRSCRLDDVVAVRVQAYLAVAADIVVMTAGYLMEIVDDLRLGENFHPNFCVVVLFLSRFISEFRLRSRPQTRCPRIDLWNKMRFPCFIT